MDFLDKDYYEILEVSPRASKEVIEHAYRALIKKHHPDSANGNLEKTKELNEAKDILLDEYKRKEYDKKRKTKKDIQPEPIIVEIPRKKQEEDYKDYFQPEQPISPPQRVSPEKSIRSSSGVGWVTWFFIIYLFTLLFAIIGWFITGILPIIIDVLSIL